MIGVKWNPRCDARTTLLRYIVAYLSVHEKID
jgi:hypothetical protein